MKKLLIYISKISVGVFIISSAALFIVNAGLKKQQNNSFYTLNHIFYNNENHDLLMIGHSRSKNCINPAIVDSMCKVNSFNTGNYDYKAIECKLMLELYLASHHPKPKYILLVLDNEIVNTDMDFYFTEQFYPYIHNDIIYSTLHKYSNNYFIVRNLPFAGITRYNDYMKFLALKAFIEPLSTDKNAYKGFLPKQGDSGKRAEDFKYTSLEPTQKGVALLDDFFKITKQNNLEVFVFIPAFYSDSNVVRPPVLSSNFFNEVNTVMSKYENVKVFDMSNASFKYHKEYFFDEGHLNLKGANEFSRIISDSLKGVINNGN